MSENFCEKTDLNKHIVYLNSSNTIFNNNLLFDCYFDLTEPIRDAVFIKLLKTELVLNPTNNINGNVVNDTDPIFVVFKQYHRVSSSIIVNGSYQQIKCFEVIPLNFGHNPPNSFLTFKQEYTSTGCNINDINTHVLNPVEQNLKRFDIQLYDKNYNIIPKSSIKNFNMSLCIYSNKRKFGMI